MVDSRFRPRCATNDETVDEAVVAVIGLRYRGRVKNRPSLSSVASKHTKIRLKNIGKSKIQ